ncbi:hypothetical protein Tco_1492918 [Tanacetum coccineum]
MDERSRSPLASASIYGPPYFLSLMHSERITCEDTAVTDSVSRVPYGVHVGVWHSKGLASELPGPEDTIVDFPEGKVDERVFLTVIAWRTGAPKDGMPAADSYSALDVVTLNTRRTPIQKQPELLLCLVGLSQSYFRGDDMYPTFLNDDDDDWGGALNLTKVKIESRPRAAYEVPLLTATSNCVIDMEDITGTSKSSGTPSVIEKSPLDFSNEDPPPAITERGMIEDQVQAEVSNEAPSVENPQTTGVILIPDVEHEPGAMGSLVRKKRGKRGNDEADVNAPPKVLRKDHASVHPKKSNHRGKSLAAIGLEADSTFTSAAQETPADNTNLARQVALRSQLRLRFEQEVRLLKKAKAQVARRNERIHVKEEEIKRLGEEVESLKAVETEVYGLRN